MVAGVHSPRYVTDPAFRTQAGAVQGSYVLEILVNAAGYLTDWFRDGFAACAPSSDLNAAVATVPPGCDGLRRAATGCDGLLTLPYWNAVQWPYWDANARGATIGWHGGHTPAHLYRSVLEGVAYESRCQLAGVERVTGEPVAGPARRRRRHPEPGVDVDHRRRPRVHRPAQR
jgi:xylulokinase